MTNRRPSGLSETDIFFTHIMPRIHDVAELKVILSVFYLLHHKQGYPSFVTYGELLSNGALVTEMGEEALYRALDLAVKHGAILHSTLTINGRERDAYFANTDSNREAIDSIKRGKLEEIAEPPNIFALYEQNIGMLTPMITEELREAEKLYPNQWIRDAFKEAVALNKRNWRYIARILERWAIEGKDSGENRQNNKKGGPNKYIRGKYGRLVKR